MSTTRYAVGKCASSCSLPAGLSEGQRAGISFAEWSKNVFFAPQKRHITPTLYITWRKDEVRVKEKNSKDSEAAGGANAPAYWAPASLIRPTPKKTPIA